MCSPTYEGVPLYTKLTVNGGTITLSTVDQNGTVRDSAILLEGRLDHPDTDRCQPSRRRPPRPTRQHPPSTPTATPTSTADALPDLDAIPALAQ